MSEIEIGSSVKVCFSIHCINKVSVDLTHYSLPLVQTHTHQMYTYLVSFGQQVQVEGHTWSWPSLSNVPYTTSTHITSINLSGGQKHRVCWSCVSGLEVVLISSGVDVLLGAEKLNSSSEEQETDNTPITIDHSMSYSLCTHPLTTCTLHWSGTH